MIPFFCGWHRQVLLSFPLQFPRRMSDQREFINDRGSHGSVPEIGHRDNDSCDHNDRGARWLPAIMQRTEPPADSIVDTSTDSMVTYRDMRFS